jgi:hypothetical protein
MTSGSSIKAMIRTAPPQAEPVSIPKTRFRRCVQVTASGRTGTFRSP